MNDDKSRVTYTKSKIISRVSKRAHLRPDTVRRVYDSLEQELVDMLSEAAVDTDVSLRIFEGITLDGRYIPPHDKLNNLTGEMITTREKIKTKANVTRYYDDKVLRAAKSHED